VVLRPLSAEEKQAVFDRYKKRGPKPKLKAEEMVPPMYPIEMQEKGSSQQVTAYLVVSKDGIVKGVYVTD
jgi:hypothetical protein